MQLRFSYLSASLRDFGSSSASSAPGDLLLRALINKKPGQGVCINLYTGLEYADAGAELPVQLPNMTRQIRGLKSGKPTACR